MKTRIRIGAKGVADEKLHEIVKWAEEHSWVGMQFVEQFQSNQLSK